MNQDDWKEELKKKNPDIWAKLPEFYKSGDLERLQRANWEELAFYVWRDTIECELNKGQRSEKPIAINHAQKWHGMLTARMLAKLDEGGKYMARLAKYQFILAISQVVLVVAQIVMMIILAKK